MLKMVLVCLVNKKFSAESWNGICWKGSQKRGQALEQSPQGSKWSRCQVVRLQEQSTIFQLAGTCNDNVVHLPEQFRADSKVNYVVKGIV